MKKSIVLLFLVMILTACGGNGDKSGTSSKGTKKLTASEQIAIDFINLFRNSSEVEAKQKFIEDSVHPEMQPLFSMLVNAETDEDTMLLNPQVVKSTTYAIDGEDDGELVLVKADNQKEVIILISESKFAWLFEADVEETKQAYEELKTNFK